MTTMRIIKLGDGSRIEVAEWNLRETDKHIEIGISCGEYRKINKDYIIEERRYESIW